MKFLTNSQLTTILALKLNTYIVPTLVTEYHDMPHDLAKYIYVIYLTIY